MPGKRSSFSIVASFMLICLQTPAQFSYVKEMKLVKGYVIYNSGDTVQGYIAKPGRNARASALYFKKGDIDQATRKINPIEIQRFVFGNLGKTYVSAEVPMQDGRSLGFVNLLMDGTYPVCYYEFLGNQHILIRGPDNKLYDILYPPDYDMPVNLPAGENKLEHSLRTVFSDNNELMSGIWRVKPDRNSIMEYLVRYYDLNKIPYKVYGKLQFSFKPGFTAGMNTDWLTYKPMPGTVLTSAIASPAAGVSVYIYEKVTGFSLLAEDMVSYDSFHFSYSYGTAGVSTEFRESFIKTATNNFRIGFSWCRYASSGVKGFFEGGGSLLSFLNPSYDNYQESLHIDTEMVNSSYNNNKIVPALYAGGFLRTGITFRIQGSSFLSAFLGGSYLLGSADDRLVSLGLGVRYQLNLK